MKGQNKPREQARHKAAVMGKAGEFSCRAVDGGSGAASLRRVSDPLSWLLPLHLAVTGAMAGVLAVVQAAVYPLFDAVGREEFAAYHRRYTARIGWVVGPLMAAELVTAVLLLAAGLRGGAFGGSLALLGLVWATTAGVQVRLHRRLAAGFDPSAYRRLVATNWVRTAAWAARAGLVAWVMAGRG